MFNTMNGFLDFNWVYLVFWVRFSDNSRQVALHNWGLNANIDDKTYPKKSM